MTKCLTCAFAAFIASVALALDTPSTEEMKAKETAAWQAFKDKKADDFKKVVDPNMVGIYSDGIADMTKQIADMGKWDLKSFAISDFKSHSGGKDVVVTSYKVTLQGTFDGKDVSGLYNSGSVWKIENGQWLAIFHTNIKAESAAGADAEKKK